MNVLNKQGTGYVPIGIDLDTIQHTKMQDRSGAATAVEDRIVTNEANLGLCSNCDNSSHCMWQRNNKMFCEHYQ